MWSQAAPPKKKTKKVKVAADAAAAGEASAGSSASDQSTVNPDGAVSPPVSSAEPAVEVDPLAVENFALSGPVKKQLASKGITALFPIQVCVAHATSLHLCMVLLWPASLLFVS